MKPDKTFIPLRLYKRVVDSVPIVGVDIVVGYEGGVLLIKRSEKPAKNVWWFPGGRVLKYEAPKNAAVRIVKKETGLKSRVKNFVGVYTTAFERWPSINHFSIHLVFYVLAKGRIKLDKTSSNYKIIKNIEVGMHPHIKRVLKDSHVFSLGFIN